MSILLHTANVLNALLPVREVLGLRRALLNAGGIVAGKGSRITHGVKFYGRHIRIGKSVWIGMNTVFASTERGRITVGDNVDIAPGCQLISGTHEIGESGRRAGKGDGAQIVIGTGTWVGAGSCILGGAQIGDGSIIAAGSVVLPGSYPPNVLLAGVPARIKRSLP